MTKKDDPSRVASGWNDIERRRPRKENGSGNGADGNGTLTGGEPAFADYGPPGFCSLSRVVLDTLDRGVIAIDASRAVIDANLQARRVLDTKEAIRVCNGRLRFVDPCVDDQLTCLLTALSSPCIVPHGFVAHLNRCSGLRPPRVLVTPVRNGATEPAAAVLIHIFDSHRERTISHDVLRDLYGLTAAQAAVTANLFAGHSVDRTAELLGLSVNTVRSHLKCIFTKCGVHSQTELLHLLDLGPHSI
jgi:DNA-binding CsgD family transcriptional regulator